MNRPIKLRAWNKERGGFVALSSLNQLTDPALSITQFTGIYDASGREIWEGDIVRWSFDCPKDKQAGVYHYVVVFQNGCFGTIIPEGEDFTPYEDISPNELVVGNRFLDADLLTQNVEY